MAIVRGEADIYLHSGGNMNGTAWPPSQSPVPMASHCSRIDGSPLRYNMEDVYLPDLLIARPEDATRVLALLNETD